MPPITKISKVGACVTITIPEKMWTNAVHMEWNNLERHRKRLVWIECLQLLGKLDGTSG